MAVLDGNGEELLDGKGREECFGFSPCGATVLVARGQLGEPFGGGDAGVNGEFGLAVEGSKEFIGDVDWIGVRAEVDPRCVLVIGFDDVGEGDAEVEPVGLLFEIFFLFPGNEFTFAEDGFCLLDGESSGDAALARDGVGIKHDIVSMDDLGLVDALDIELDEFYPEDVTLLPGQLWRRRYIGNSDSLLVLVNHDKAGSAVAGERFNQ